MQSASELTEVKIMSKFNRNVGDECEFKNCTRKIVSSRWDTRPLVILLQRCCEECYNEQSEILWEIGS